MQANNSYLKHFDILNTNTIPVAVNDWRVKLVTKEHLTVLAELGRDVRNLLKHDNINHPGQ